VGIDNSTQSDLLDFSYSHGQQASTAQYTLYLPIFSHNLLRLSDFVEFVPGKGWRGFLGEVINGTAIPYSVTLSAVISDTISDTLRTEIVYPLLDVTLPGQLNPYAYTTSGYDIVESISIESSASKLLPVYLPVTVPSKEYLCNNIYGGYMAGTVRNDNPYPIDSIKGYFWNLDPYPTMILFFVSSIPCQGKDVGVSNSIRLAADYSVYLPMIFKPAWFMVSGPVIYQLYKDGYAAVGEVNNSTQVPYVLTLEASITSADGTTITRTVNTSLTATLPDQPNPFYIDNIASDDLIRVSIKDASAIDSSTYIPLTIASKQYQDLGAGWGRVYGIVRNDSNYSLSFPGGIVWSLEPLALVYTGMIIDKLSLQPGEETPFTTAQFPAYPTATAEMYQAAFQGVISP
jgi:hypothetical protein